MKPKTAPKFLRQKNITTVCRSAELMYIPFEYTTEQLTALTYEVLERNGFTNAYIRPIVFCSPNMALSKGQQSYLAIEAWEDRRAPHKMRIKTSSFQRPNLRHLRWKLR
jgi:branched-chain amino acid aminotransferase